MTWSIPPAVTNSAIVVAAISLLGLLLRQINPWRDRVAARVDKLERRLDNQGRRHDTHIEILRQLHEGEIALLRHRLAGEEQLSIALFSVLQTLDVPQRTLDALSAQRSRKAEAIADEQAALTRLRAAAVERLAALALETDE